MMRGVKQKKLGHSNAVPGRCKKRRGAGRYCGRGRQRPLPWTAI